MEKIFVHKYKWSHAQKRRKFRKLHKQGKVVKILTTSNGWLYGMPSN